MADTSDAYVAEAVTCDGAALRIVALLWTGPAAIDVGLRAVLDAVPAAWRLAQASGAHTRDAVTATRTAFAHVAGIRTGPTAVRVRFGAIEDPVAAGWRLADVAAAHTAGAVAARDAPLAVVAILRTRSAAIDVGLRSVFDAVRTGRCQTRQGGYGIARAANAVGIFQARVPVRTASAGRSAAIDVGLVAVFRHVIAASSLTDECDTTAIGTVGTDVAALTVVARTAHAAAAVHVGFEAVFHTVAARGDRDRDSFARCGITVVRGDRDGLGVPVPVPPARGNVVGPGAGAAIARDIGGRAGGVRAVPNRQLDIGTRLRLSAKGRRCGRHGGPVARARDRYIGTDEEGISRRAAEGCRRVAVGEAGVIRIERVAAAGRAPPQPQAAAQRQGARLARDLIDRVHQGSKRDGERHKPVGRAVHVQVHAGVLEVPVCTWIELPLAGLARGTLVRVPDVVRWVLRRIGHRTWVRDAVGTVGAQVDLLTGVVARALQQDLDFVVRAVFVDVQQDAPAKGLHLFIRPAADRGVAL